MSPLRPTTLALLGVATLMGCDAPAPTVAQRTATPFADAVIAPDKPTHEVEGMDVAGSIAMDLPNADYVIGTTSSGKAPLKNGLYEETIPNSSSKNVVQLGADRAYGDLDGDGSEDAAVTLLTSSGGSGNFTYVAAVLNKNGAAKPLVSIQLGDRITMKAMRIADRQIHVTWLDRKSGEPMSTPPSEDVSRVFSVQGGTMFAVAPGVPKL